MTSLPPASVDFFAIMFARSITIYHRLSRLVPLLKCASVCRCLTDQMSVFDKLGVRRVDLFQPSNVGFYFCGIIEDFFPAVPKAKKCFPCIAPDIIRPRGVKEKIDLCWVMLNHVCSQKRVINSHNQKWVNLQHEQNLTVFLPLPRCPQRGRLWCFDILVLLNLTANEEHAC